MDIEALRPCLYFYLLKRFGIEGDRGVLLLFGIILAIIVIAYLLGSINTAIILSKKLYHEDIRKTGSENAGSTNMSRIYGRRAGLLTLGGDVLKCVLAVVIGGLLVDGGEYLAALFCVIGHVFPCFFGFRGGKGVAVTATAILLTSPVVFVGLAIVFAIVLIGTKFVSLASIMCMFLYPLFLRAWNIAIDGKGDFLSLGSLVSVLLTVIVVVMHRKNIKRLLDKQEPKFSFGKKKNDVSSEPAETQPETPKVNLGNMPEYNRSKKKKGKKK